MNKERLFDLSAKEQIGTGFIGALFALEGATVAKVVIEKRLCKAQGTISIPPKDRIYDCPPYIKAGEFAIGSGIIITSVFAAAAIGGAIKRFSHRKSQT